MKFVVDVHAPEGVGIEDMTNAQQVADLQKVFTYAFGPGVKVLGKFAESEEE